MMIAQVKLFFDNLIGYKYSFLQGSLETQLRKPDILTADLSKMEVRSD